MFEKLKEKFKKDIKISKTEKRIRELNDNDKGLKVLKKLRILATPRILNIIGIVLFLFVFEVTNILIRVIDFIGVKLSNPSKVYPFYKFLLANYKFWLVYLIIFIFLIIFYIKLRMTIKASFENLENGQKGSGRILTKEEVKSEYREIPEKFEMFKGKGCMPISRGEDNIYIDISPTYTIVIGTMKIRRYLNQRKKTFQ